MRVARLSCGSDSISGPRAYAGLRGLRFAEARAELPEIDDADHSIGIIIEARIKARHTAGLAKRIAELSKIDNAQDAVAIDVSIPCIKVIGCHGSQYKRVARHSICIAIQLLTVARDLSSVDGQPIGSVDQRIGTACKDTAKAERDERLPRLVDHRCTG